MAGAFLGRPAKASRLFFFLAPENADRPRIGGGEMARANDNATSKRARIPRFWLFR
jgi:hypothetical protein